MIYSNACAYAIRAISRLAMIRPDGYVLLNDLCQDTDLPRHFVAKIFQDLVRKGILTSAKGRGGGFALAKRPNQISLYEIVSAIDGVEQLDHCVLGLVSCDDKQACPQHEQWKPIRQRLKNFLLETSLKEMAQTMKRKMEMTGSPLPVISRASKPMVS